MNLFYYTYVIDLSHTSETVKGRKTLYLYIFEQCSGMGNEKYFWSLSCFWILFLAEFMTSWRLLP